MPATAEIIISGRVNNTPTGGRIIGPIALTSADANGVVQLVTLASGDNTITLPVSPVPNYCIIKLPSNNTALTKLIGPDGGPGITISKVGVTLLSFHTLAPPNDLVLNSDALQTSPTEVIFI